MIPYVGDLSRLDAELLRRLAERSDRVLEFGCGASTQIFAAYARGTVDSVDTEAIWIERTKRQLQALEIPRAVTFHPYQAFTVSGAYDLIFVDGLNELRLPFALMTWPALAVGGAMSVHDTRRTRPYGKAALSDVQCVCAILEAHALEIDTVAMNQANSNTTVIVKRLLLAYEDYNAIEGRTPRQLGLT